MKALQKCNDEADKKEGEKYQAKPPSGLTTMRVGSISSRKSTMPTQTAVPMSIGIIAMNPMKPIAMLATMPSS
eukprot:CAMPEP_0197670918 /NCGR_PEP_ID=MMETSP1338-20131121/75614_1 /TAXON_ID=43686 ORGANISM="Pelagodinium beii, Strain RCC1491" /NCGR_SAMPLE_ID=MMETSP1338 /ASSEMBLY_ACC=CAM_ASM_000754 /LENGTH=72 /DNA_ID=CAMNT_0043250723 /DNA_START=104 /DNA_END=319 /DNA_ORIENTATION=+